MKRVGVLVCPDKFRGSLTAQAAAEAMSAGLRIAGQIDLDVMPLADGGEGTLDVLLAAIGGERRSVDTVDARGRPVRAEWGWLVDGTAVVESASAAGLQQVSDYIDPVAANTAGLGRLVRHVLAEQPRRLVVAVGGTAATDGGLGLLEEIGWTLRGVETIVACDVRTTFVAAARVFGPQKGAGAAQVSELTLRLEALAGRYAAKGRAISEVTGSGAGGGLAGGLAAIGATLQSGFEVVATAVRFESRLQQVQAVLTGEGRLDAASLDGKIVGRVLQAPGSMGLTRGAIVGVADDRIAGQLRAEAVDVRTLSERADDDQDSATRASLFVSELAEEWAMTRLRPQRL